MLRYVSSRWLSLKPAILRILNQWANLKHYFITFLLTVKNFKNEIQNTERYQRIVKLFQDDMTRAYLSFVAFVAQDFENFLFQLQKREPMIHMLYCTMTNLLVTLLHKFALDANMKQVNDGQLKPAAELAKLDVTKKESHKKLSSVEIGTKTRVFLA